METGISQVYELKGSKGGITAKVTVTEEYDIQLNCSYLSVAFSVKSSSYYNHTYYLTGSVKVDGEKLVTMNAATPTHYVTVGSLNSYYRIRAQSDKYTGSPWSAELLHSTDGSKTIRIEVSVKGYTTSGGGGSGWSVADSREITLTHIPRANAIGASDGDIGSVSTVSIVRRSTEYTHSVAYAFGTLTGWLDSDGNITQTETMLTQSSIPFRIPERFYDQIPNAPSGSCTLTCRTYHEGVQIGEEQYGSFTVTANRELCAPSVSGTVRDGNPLTLGLTGDDCKLVRFASQAVCVIQAQAKNGAAITRKTVAGTVTEDTVSLEQVETGSFQFTATDSRGYVGAAVVEAELIPYTRLTAVVAAQRTDPTSGKAVLTVTGNCFNGSFGAQSNRLEIRCRVDGGEALTFTPVWEGNAYSLSAELTGLDYLRNHTLEVEVADCIETVIKYTYVGKGVPVFHWGENDFAFRVPVSFGGCRAQQLADPEEDTDGANKAYADTLAAQTLAAGALRVEENLAAVLLSSKSLSGTATVTVSGGWSAGYRLYMILLTIADDDAPMVQLLVPREAVTGRVWSVSTAASSKKLRISHEGEDLIVEAVGYTGSGGGSTAFIYGLFPQTTAEEI